jgi:hypothetical protein
MSAPPPELFVVTASTVEHGVHYTSIKLPRERKPNRFDSDFVV